MIELRTKVAGLVKENTNTVQIAIINEANRGILSKYIDCNKI